jgi:hypothetical protein
MADLPIQKIEKMYLTMAASGEFIASFSLSGYRFFELPVDVSGMSPEEREEFYKHFWAATQIINEASSRKKMAEEAKKLEDEGIIKMSS